MSHIHPPHYQFLFIQAERVFFVNGPRGSGKTFLYNLILAKVRSQGLVALGMASSGIAALLLADGTTGHFRLKLPIPILNNSTLKYVQILYLQYNMITDKSMPRFTKNFGIQTCAILNLQDYTGSAQVLKKASLIIWDEAPMTHKHNYEAVDHSLRDIMNINKPFGGLTVLPGGDFRQVLPVVSRGTRSQQITAASLKRSTLWPHVSVKPLPINMRVRMLTSAANAGSVGAQLAAQQGQDFADLLIRLGNGTEQTYPVKGEDYIKLPQEMCARSDSVTDLINEVIYPRGQHDPEAAIMVARNVEVDDINAKAIALFEGEVCLQTYHKVIIKCHFLI